MDETRRFLRYVIPGLVFLMELAVFLWLPEQGLTWVLDKLPKPSGSTESVITAGIAALVTSGGIGYLLALIYHLILAPFTVDFRDVLKDP